MRVVIPGGSGQVGTILARAFHRRGDDVVVLSRRRYEAPWSVVVWDAVRQGPWAREVDGADVLINLAGRNVNCRYTPANRRAILNSRVRATEAIGAAVAASVNPPAIWLQASTATIYAHRYDAPNDEAHGRVGGTEPGAPRAWRFSIEVARAWERACTEVQTPSTRRVLLRSAMIMSPDRGGIFDTLLALVRVGLGGTAGHGRQYVSWVHDHDFVRAIRYVIENADLDGPINISSPSPLPNRDFMRDLRRAWRMPIGFPASRWMLAVGAVFMRTETELVLKSRRVVPGRLMASGFQFAYPGWPDAARDLCDRWRQGLVEPGA